MWEKFLEDNPDIAKKLDGLPLADPVAEIVDAAIQVWTATPKDEVFELTVERRELLIRVIKESAKYDIITNSPFYQYIRAYVLYLHTWMVENEKYDVVTGQEQRINYLRIFENIIAVAYILGYATQTVKPPKRKKRG